MKPDNLERSIGFQRLACKNTGCSYLFKEIHFSSDWTAVTALDSGVALTCSDGAPYYLCPQCKARNIVARQGEKIIIEKIVRVEIVRGESLSAGIVSAGSPA